MNVDTKKLSQKKLNYQKKSQKKLPAKNAVWISVTDSQGLGSDEIIAPLGGIIVYSSKKPK